MQRTLFAVAIWLSACMAACMAESAQGPGAQTPRAAEPDASTCKDEQATGTLMIRRVCLSPEQAQSDQMAKQSWWNHWPPNPMRGDPTYPGVDARHPTVTSPD